MLYFEVVLVSVYQIYQIYSFYFQKRYIYLIANTSLIPKNVTFKVLRMQQKQFRIEKYCNSRKPIFYMCCLLSNKSNWFGNKFFWRFIQLVHYFQTCFLKYFFRDACLFYCILLILERDHRQISHLISKKFKLNPRFFNDFGCKSWLIRWNLLGVKKEIWRESCVRISWK